MAVFNLKHDGRSVDITVNEEDLIICSSQDSEVKILIDDVIAVDDVHSSSVDHKDDSNAGSSLSCVLYFITKRDNPRWSLQKIMLTDSGDGRLQYFISKLKPLIMKCVGNRPQKLLFLLNPIGGRRQAQKHFDNIIVPVLQVAGVTWELIVSQRRNYLIEVVSTYRYEDFDGVVVLGGDGTFCEVVNVMLQREQEADLDYCSETAKLKPLSTPVGVIPSGSGNSKALALYGCLDILTAILHIIKGNTRFVSMATVHSDDKLLGVYGVLFANAHLSDFCHFGELHLRFLRDFRYYALPLWYFFQSKETYPYEVTIFSRETTTYDEQGTQREKITEKQETIQLPCMMVNCFLEEYEEGPGLRLLTFDSLSTLAMARFIIDAFRRVPINIHGITHYQGDAFKISINRSRDERLDKKTKLYRVLLDGEFWHSDKESYLVRCVNDVVSMYSSRTQ